jgi:hypothetical protein
LPGVGSSLEEREKGEGVKGKGEGEKILNSTLLTAHFYTPKLL